MLIKYLLNISDLKIYFYVKIATVPPPPPEKSHPLFPRNPPLKVEVLLSPLPLFENLVGGSIPSLAERGVHTTLPLELTEFFLLSLVTSLIFQCFLIFSMIFPKAELFLNLQKSLSKIFFGYFLNFVFNSKYGF